MTVDGSDPTEADADREPIAIPGDAMVVRARAWAADRWPSRVATATYLARTPGSLPVIALTTDPSNLWDEDRGIYVYGTEYEDEFPFHGANFWEDWERPVHAEMWEPDGQSAFVADGTVEIHGNNTRAFEQKALLVHFDGKPVDHEIFPGLGITKFGRLVLRAGGNDWHGCYRERCETGAHIRDGLMHTIAADTGVDVLAYRPTELYLDGEFWGLYDIRERPDAEYIKAHHGFDDIDLLEYDGFSDRGDTLQWQYTLDFLRTEDLSDPDLYAEVEALIDVDELATYLALEVFYDNTDWPGNNIRWWRPRTADGRWRWLMYDTDFGLGEYYADPDEDSLAMALAEDGPIWPNPPWSTELCRLLLTSPEFETTFANRYAELLATTLSADSTRATLKRLADAIAPDMPRQVARWGTWTDGTTTNTMPAGTWEKQIARLDRWLADRPAHAREHVVQNLGLDGTFTMSLTASPADGGTFALSVAEVAPPFTGTWFAGVPVTVTAVPAEGRRFVRWSDQSLPREPTVQIMADDADVVSLQAVFE